MFLHLPLWIKLRFASNSYGTSFEQVRIAGMIRHQQFAAQKTMALRTALGLSRVSPANLHLWALRGESESNVQYETHEENSVKRLRTLIYA